MQTMNATGLGWRPKPQTPVPLEPTGSDIEGPFYRSQSLPGDKLCDETEPGDKLILQGRILDIQGNPVAGAKVDVWQADKAGHYDIDDPKDKDNPAFPYKFRAHQVTGDDGSFEFKTIRPGHYQIGENRWRTGHIHVKVNDDAHSGLATQLYFPEDLMIPGNQTSDLNDKDSWFDPKRVLDMVSHGNGWTRGRYDIVLADRDQSAA